MIRLGTEYGGWWIPKNSIDKNSICYLAGAGEDITFDLALSELYDPMIHIFDPTPRAKKHFENTVKNNDRIVFHEIGIYNNDGIMKFYGPAIREHCSHSIENLQKTDYGFNAEVKKYSSIMKWLGHDHIDLLKLDIEGAELKVLDDIILNKATLPRILLVEFDDQKIEDARTWVAYNELKKELMKLYNLVNVEHDNWTLIKI
jgi:FkbM family methyltransferase